MYILFILYILFVAKNVIPKVSCVTYFILALNSSFRPHRILILSNYKTTAMANNWSRHNSAELTVVTVKMLRKYSANSGISRLWDK